MRKEITKAISHDSVYAIIPARSGSKSLPDKNIRDLNGFPMIAYTIAAAKLASCIDRIIVSTDSEKYALIAKQYGAEIPVLRPAEISQDNSTDLEFMEHIINWLYDNEGVVPAYFAHLRVTCPIRTPDMIDNAVTMIKAHPEASCLLSACIPQGVDTPYKWLIKDGQYFKSIFFEDNDDANRARQSYPCAYMRSIYVDILTTKNIVLNQSLFGGRILAFETGQSIDIDDIHDFENAKRALGENGNELYQYLQSRV